MVSVNHQIHCLNDLRQNLHPGYYYPTGFHSPLHWEYVYRCLRLILQTLQCNTDVGIITCNRKESQEYPVPDFSYNMMCRDFDGLRKWQDEAMMPVETIEVDEARRGEGGPGLAEVGGVDEGGSEAEGEGDGRDDDG
jgi:hypothetical protein